tara:strand:- start:751 stop:1311 length:561 start_codon:yes stop_codon:yes gene_type:complete
MEQEFDNTYKELELFSERVVDKAKQLLAVKRTRKNSRGNNYSTKINTSESTLSKSLIWDLDKNRGGVSFGAGGAGSKYVEYVEDGRRPGKQPPMSDILKWVRIKPLKPRDLKTGKFLTANLKTLKQIAYLIARKIGKYGTPATNFYAEAFIEEYNKLDATLQGEWIKDIEFNVDYTMSKLDNIKLS